MTDQPPDRDEHGRFKASKHPAGGGAWEPYSDIGTEDANGVVTGRPGTHDELLLSKGLDPDEWEITNMRFGEYKGVTSTRWSARRRARPLVEHADLSEIMAAIHLWGIPQPAPKLFDDGKEAFVVALADWQIGGTGPGGGSRETTERILALGAAVRERVVELRASGRTLPHLVVLGLGDLVESCTGFYSNQPFTVDLDNREQMKLAYSLLVALLRQWSELFPRVTIVPIGGNHGETRSAFKVETGPNDNKDVLAFEIARDIFNENPGFDHLEWQIPGGELSQVVEAGGAIVGVTHGHMFSGGANAGAKAEKWWKNQVFGKQPVRTADILISGHFHHFSSIEFSDEGRTWFQCPAEDNGSEWFTNFSGQSSAPGTLTMRVGRACGPRLWDDLKIL